MAAPFGGAGSIGFLKNPMLLGAALGVALFPRDASATQRVSEIGRPAGIGFAFLGLGMPCSASVGKTGFSETRFLVGLPPFASLSAAFSSAISSPMRRVARRLTTVA